MRFQCRIWENLSGSTLIQDGKASRASPLYCAKPFDIEQRSEIRWQVFEGPYKKNPRKEVL